jgi:hypothetical protein
VNVDVLQMHLSNLSQLLRSAGGKSTANELDELCQLLQPFRDKKLKDLIASISKAEEIIRNGAAASKPRKASSKTSDLAPISARIIDLYQRAGLPSVSREEILGAFSELEALNPTGPQLKAIANQIGIREKLNKVLLFSKMRQTVLDRKGVADRALA